MPELPEVEITRLSLAPGITGARVLGARLGKALRWPLGVELDQLRGATVGAPARRGKYLWLPLMGGTAAQASSAAPVAGPPAVEAACHGHAEERDVPGLLIHLGMSGALRFGHELGTPGPHDHFELATDRGLLRLTDPRRFGAVVWSADLALQPASRLLASLGVEPLGPAFSASVLHAGLAGRRVSIKQALLAGDVVVGVGNIYCSEALFEARIDPRTPAHRVGAQRCARLVDAIQSTLLRALAAGGSTLKDFRNAHGMGGEFQLQARVYGRAGQPCMTCQRPVTRLLQGQRATFFCASCQHR
jgi:formamidopyrimidine-DNA glycosylase